MIVNGFTSKASALRHLQDAGYRTSGLLAAPESNPKIAKNGKVVGVLSFPLHLAPASLSGFNVCPQASQGCIAACLHTAGNPAYMAGKSASRITKTQAFMRERKAFMALLAFEIEAAWRKALKAGMDCGIRLNATSDIAWEAVGLEIDGHKVSNLMTAFNGVTFYDYTKVTKRALRCASGDRWPSNYHLTFSKSEANDADCVKVLRSGGNVAAVFSPSRLAIAFDQGGAWIGVEEQGEFAPIVDGDLHDYRPADPLGVIVALKAKGDAKSDMSGFVVR